MKITLYNIALISILILSLFFRFSRFNDRWGLAYDQSHDALVARYAVNNYQIPLLGPFSSAGPFQTSGAWYWFIMLGTFIFPNIINGPWVLLSIIYAILPLGMVYLGKQLINKNFGLLFGFISIFSTAQIAQGINLTNQSPLAITSLLALISFVNYGKYRKQIWLFYLGFLVSLSATIHLQGASLFLLIIIGLPLIGLRRLRDIFPLLVGIALPTIPVLLFDLKHDFFTVKGMIRYVTVDQYNISLDVLARRWKTFLIQFIPAEWSHVIGGAPWIGGILMILSALSSGFMVIHPKKNKLIISIFISMVCMITVLRYTRTPLFSSYLVFLHPFILLFSALCIYFGYQKHKLLGIIIFIIVLVFSINKTFSEIKYGTNNTNLQISTWVKAIKLIYPSKKFDIYDYFYDANTQSVTLGLYLYKENLIDDNGVKLAVMRHPYQTTPSGSLVFQDGNRQIFDVSASDSATLERLGWIPVNPKHIYNSTENWINNK